MGSTVGSALLPIQWEDEEEEEEVSDQASVPLDQSTSIVFNFKVLNLLSRQKQTDLLRFRHNPMSGCETRVPVFNHACAFEFFGPIRSTNSNVSMQ